MKYTVTAWIDEDTKYEVEVGVRLDAKKKTVFHKCMNEIVKELLMNDVSISRKYGFETPSLLNGCVGAAWLEEPFINVTIQEETGAWIAL